MYSNVCPICGKSFTTPSKSQRACSRACGIAFRDLKRPPLIDSPQKKCSDCKKDFPRTSEYFPSDKSRGDGLAYKCYACCSTRGRVLYQKDDTWKNRNRDADRRVRLEVLMHYGGDPPSCACCDLHGNEFLAIDHLGGGGNQHKKSLGISSLHRWLRKNGYPEGFRILCHNCNWALGHGGVCPHTDPEWKPDFKQATWQYWRWNYRQKLKLAALQHYGGIVPQCACCGEDHLRFLTVDHIDGGGGKHRQEIRAEGRYNSVYDWAKFNGYPAGFRVLCFNCNCALGFYGRCPHKSEQRP